MNRVLSQTTLLRKFLWKFCGTSVELRDCLWRQMFPLGFLLGLRSNQAYGRYLEGISHYTDLVRSAADLCRQT